MLGVNAARHFPYLRLPRLWSGRHLGRCSSTRFLSGKNIFLQQNRRIQGFPPGCDGVVHRTFQRANLVCQPRRDQKHRLRESWVGARRKRVDEPDRVWERGHSQHDTAAPHIAAGGGVRVARLTREQCASISRVSIASWPTRNAADHFSMMQCGRRLRGTNCNLKSMAYSPPPRSDQWTPPSLSRVVQ